MAACHAREEVFAGPYVSQTGRIVHSAKDDRAAKDDDHYSFNRHSMRGSHFGAKGSVRMDLGFDKAQSAYLRMKAALLQHRTPAGTFLNIRSIAEKLRVSATPIREALIRLADEEIIEFVSGRGFYAKSIKIADLRAEYEMAFVIAKHAIEKNLVAYDRVTAVTDARPLSPGTADTEKITDAEHPAFYIEGIYERISMLSGNARMVRATRRFNEHTHFIRRFGLVTMPGYVDVLSEMTRLEGFLRTGDQACALDALARQYHAKDKMLEDVVQQFEFAKETARIRFEGLLD